MSVPQTPDSLRKSQQDKTPPPRDASERPGRLSNPEQGDRAQERQGGHRRG
ncbi:hypothetical protein PQS31_16215 [Luteimonas sp BLCC-B24]|uniref:hypothetical protein n=1 Tax=Luteimonas sp. BLCC-B24 TaxID=3025317 RepID=UPI00234CC212|nr:hypothetical protein [Luteimonas sp. BLCC-B24]MDC7808362.1 hypothetical protein [Luteimonas sp. BLCC-B24]